MRNLRHIVRAGTAVGTSLWIALLACVMGCAQPAMAESQVNVAPSSSKAGHGSQTGRMAGMESCHHSSGIPSGPGENRKPKPNGAVSCCPLEITLLQKWIPEKARIGASRDFVVFVNFDSELTGDSSFVATIPPNSHGGRKTLLETHLLRI